MGKQLGLQFSKKGIATVDAQSTPVSNSKKGLDEARMNSEPRYREAYVALRRQNINLSRDSVTNKMVEDHMTKRQR
jgi:hypothetical protein